MNIREAHKLARVNCDTVRHCIDNMTENGIRVDVVMMTIESLTLVSLALAVDTQCCLVTPEVKEEFTKNRERFFSFIKLNRPSFDTLRDVLDDLHTATFRVQACLVTGH